MKEYNPSDYSLYRVQKAKETLIEVEKHIENRFWNTAINRMYYACFYAVGALLIGRGISTTSHSGTRLKFGQEFVKAGLIDKKYSKVYSDLFEKRHKGDYNDFFDYDEETVKRLFPQAQEFVKVVSGLLE
jgi:uncharacterized protein (UPF0332 family)